MRPTPAPNEPLKHTNPQFYIGKTEVRSRPDWNAGPFWAPKSTIWAAASLKIIKQNVLFQPHSDQNAILMCSNALHSDFRAPMMLKSWNPSFSFSKTNNSWHP